MYRPLDPGKREIRLLNVSSKRQSRTASVECYFCYACLTDEPHEEYETVSYCWGNANDRSTILVDGQPCMVPASAERALRRLRCREMVRTLWIDSVSIDQNSDCERSQQVAMMADIYQSSTGNLIYLGEDDSAVQKALATVERLMQSINYETTTNSHRQFRSTLYGQTNSDPFAEAGERLGGIDFEALLWLYERPWFRRLWVIQEVALGPRNTCFCGRSVFGIRNVLRVARWLTYKKFYMPLYVTRSKGRVVASLMWDFVDPWNSADLASFHCLTDLTAILDQDFPAETTEPRDAVYGVLGLMARTRTLEKDHALLKLDYAKPVAEIYRDATRYALQERQSLRLLRHVDHGGADAYDLQGFPSWVPQYSRAERRRVDAPVLLSAVSFADGSRPVKKIVTMSSVIYQGQDMSELVLQGVLVDRIENVSEVLITSHAHEDANIEVLEAVERLTAKAQGNDDLPKLQRMVAVTLMAGKNAYSFTYWVLEKEVGNYLAYKDYVRDKDICPSPRRRLPAYTDAATGAVATWYWAFKRASTCRRFFTTENGRIGIGPRQTKAGDVVAVLYGGDWPFVLRPYGESYELLGASYVHGIMRGEAVHQHKKSGSPDTTFSIR